MSYMEQLTVLWSLLNFYLYKLERTLINDLTPNIKNATQLKIQNTIFDCIGNQEITVCYIIGRILVMLSL